ncbi:MAG TPA: histidine kinase [Thermoflexia bacterium]|nr:histidine kinase [Thermoflexia bacterium]
MLNRCSPTRERTTAIITMGGQAQVVTFSLDGLLERGEQVTDVLVLHFSLNDPRVRRALSQLSAEFAGDRYRGHPILFRRLLIQAEEGPLDAIRTGRDAEVVWAAARDLLAELKREGHCLHLCIAGGPRLLALTLVTAAMLHCDHRDRLWHLYTPREFLEKARDGAILHAPPEAGVRLVPVPFVPWGAYFPALRALARPPSLPFPVPDPADAARCAEVWQRLTPRQQEVLRTLAEGFLPQEAAERLGITLKTLDTHKTQILAECRVAWALPEDTRLTYHFLREKFGQWLALHPPSEG